MSRLIVLTLAGALLTFGFGGSVDAQNLPDGAAKETVKDACTACHSERTIVRTSGYSPEDWRKLTATMVDLKGHPDEAKIIGYLSEKFPPTKKYAPKLIDGPAKITFTEWVVPTLGQRARDPVEAPDRSIWWVGQWADIAGRIDPATEEIKEYALPAGAKPHSINIGPDGMVWYTGNKNATIGRLNPRTGQIKEFHTGDPNARDPHTAVFDKNGILWFTMQQSNRIGRLDPATGEIDIREMPTENSRPYGIKLDESGAPWVVCNGGNCIVRVDPETMKITEYNPSDSGTTIRRLDFDDEGNIWFVNSGLGRLGKFDPKTGKAKEWPSPSGPDSHPYAIAVVNGIVWYNESRKRPDALVRFDPKTEKFQSWAIPSGEFYAGIIRHMRPTRDGNLLIHQSSTNRIILVTIAK